MTSSSTQYDHTAGDNEVWGKLETEARLVCFIPCLSVFSSHLFYFVLVFALDENKGKKTNNEFLSLLLKTGRKW